jgi:hypothetical protein
MKGQIACAMMLLCAVAEARAEDIKCPPPQSPLTENKWGTEYSGWITEVMVTRMFTNYRENAVVSCTRATGTVKILLRKACRIIEGEGNTELLPGSKHSEGQVCKMPHRPLQFDNDQSCVVQCN